MVISRQFSYAISHYFNTNWCYSSALITWKGVSILNQVKYFSSKACKLFGKLCKRVILILHEDKIEERGRMGKRAKLIKNYLI